MSEHQASIETADEGRTCRARCSCGWHGQWRSATAPTTRMRLVADIGTHGASTGASTDTVRDEHPYDHETAESERERARCEDAAEDRWTKLAGGEYARSDDVPSLADL